MAIFPRAGFKYYLTMMIDWNDIETVFLDMDGTLLDLSFDSYFWISHLPKRYAEHHGVDETEARQHISPMLKAKEGTLEWYCLDYWSDQFKLDIQALKQEIRHLINWRSDAREFLMSLRKQNKYIVLATNAHHGSLKLKLENTDLQQFIDTILCAHDLGHAKEMPGFWEKATDMLTFDPWHSLFIDDNLHALRQAQAFGIRYLFAIDKPDSRLPQKDVAEFSAMTDFSVHANHLNNLNPAINGASRMNENRLIDLETRLAHLDDTVQVLNKTAYQQEKRLSELERISKLLLDRNKELSELVYSTNVTDEKPPHY